MMLFNKQLITNLLDEIEKNFKKKAWQVILDSVLNYIIKKKYDNSIFSEYELYYKYIHNKDTYVYINNIKYRDIKYDKFDFIKNKEYDYIADHNYIGNLNNVMKDNIMDFKLEDNLNILTLKIKNSLFNQINNIFLNYNCNLVLFLIYYNNG